MAAAQLRHQGLPERGDLEAQGSPRWSEDCQRVLQWPPRLRGQDGTRAYVQSSGCSWELRERGTRPGQTATIQKALWAWLGAEEHKDLRVILCPVQQRALLRSPREVGVVSTGPGFPSSLWKHTMLPFLKYVFIDL